MYFLILGGNVCLTSFSKRCCKVSSFCSSSSTLASNVDWAGASVVNIPITDCATSEAVGCICPEPAQIRAQAQCSGSDTGSSTTSGSGSGTGSDTGSSTTSGSGSAIISSQQSDHS